MPNVYYNDIDPYCCKVLRKNIERGNLPDGVVDERDIQTIDADSLREYQHVHLFAGIGGFPLGFHWANVPFSIRIVTGGFPCQDISEAGQRGGIEGSRSGLWREMWRISSVVRPDYIIVENVSALLRRGLSKVLGDLAAIGYDTEWHCIPASAIGAPHQRDRIWIMAYTQRGRRGQSTAELKATQESLYTAERQESTSWARSSGEVVADSDTERRDGRAGQQRAIGRLESANSGQNMARADESRLERWLLDRQRADQWLVGQGGQSHAARWRIEPGMGRVANGVSRRMDRLRGLGNAIVPQMAELIGYVIKEHHEAYI